MQTEVRYLPPRRREGGTLENVVGEKPNATRTIAFERIFAQTTPFTQPGVYEKGFSFNGGLGHHVATCKSKWQLGTTNSLTAFCATSRNTGYMGHASCKLAS